MLGYFGIAHERIQEFMEAWNNTCRKSELEVDDETEAIYMALRYATDAIRKENYGKTENT